MGIGKTPPPVKMSEKTFRPMLTYSDEAQRVWNQEQMTRKYDDTVMAVSEPKLLFSIRDRHEDWAEHVRCLTQ